MKKFILSTLILMILISLGLLIFLIFGFSSDEEIIYQNRWENSAYHKIIEGLDEQRNFKLLIPEHFFISNERMIKIAEKAFLNSTKVISFKEADYSIGIMRFEYEVDGFTRQKMAEEVEEKLNIAVNEILKTAKSDYEKLQAAHDYLVYNIEYDENLKAGYETSGNSGSSHDVYGALVEGSAVCDGYAKAYKLILDKLGIESILVYGTGEGIPHAWNMVKLNGEYYHVDVTWDDQEFDVSPVYFYFLANDDMMDNKHIWDDTYPKAAGYEENYFFRNGLVCKSRENLELLIESSLNSGKDTVQVLLWDFPHNEKIIKNSISQAILNSMTKINQYTYVYDENSDFLLVSFDGGK